MKKAFPQLTSEKLLLRQITLKDLVNIFTGLSNPEVIKYYEVSYEGLEATQEQMEWYANLEQTQTEMWWAVCSPVN